MQIRRQLAAAAALALTSTAFGAVAVPAGAAAPESAAAPSAAAKGCVTRAEYRKVKKGMPKAKVHKIFGTAGKRSTIAPLPNGGSVEGRGYKVCGNPRGAVGVSFVKQRAGATPKLGAKSAAF